MIAFTICSVPCDFVITGITTFNFPPPRVPTIVQAAARAAVETGHA